MKNIEDHYIELRIIGEKYGEVPYQFDDNGRYYSPQQAVKTCWNISIEEVEDLVGQEICLRHNVEYKVHIKKAEFFNAVLGVWIDNEWRPLDFIIKFYRPVFK